MRYKDILVYIDDNEASDTLIKLAAELAQSHEAHLIGLYVRRGLHIPSPAEVEDESGLLGSQLSLAGEFEGKARGLFEERMGHYGINSEWRVCEGRITDALSLQAHYVDLLVLGVNPAAPRNIEIVDEAMIVAGRPVLAVPIDYSAKWSSERVVIAWDGSRESARALNDSIPLLENADRVWVLTAGRDENESMAEAARICMHLSRHGVTAVPETLTAKREKEIAELIMNRAMDIDANLIVMGAYGHTRLHEVILGGVTDYVISHMKMPVLFSH